MITFFIILFWLFCALVVVAAALYLQASIHVNKEMRREKKEAENDISFKNHDWKDFKNKPW